MKKSMLTNPNHLIIESPHPSPLSAYRGFFGSRPFSRTNKYLKEHGLKEIDWQIKTSGRKNNEYLYSFDHFWFYLGKHGWESYGVFSYIPLYRRSFWTPEVIEQYKDAIVWPLLFEYGNFMLDE